ncbi:MAG: mechanosensitive ion channel family protein [Gemmatimonadaceae bacterium]
MTTFTLFLDRHWHGNTVRAWLVGATIAVAVFLITTGVRVLVIRRLEKIAGRTATPYDDFLLEVVRRTRGYFLFFLALIAGTRGLTLPGSVGRALETAMIIIALMQAGVWGSALIRAWVEHYLAQRAGSAEPANLATIRAFGVFARVMVWALLVVTALDSLGFKVSALVTGLGVGGIAVALAVQNILGDLLAAMAIVFDKPFVVGDFIVVDAFSGTVEHIGLKTTRVRSLGGEQIIFSNAELLKSRVRNFKRMVERRVAFFTDVRFDTPAAVVAKIPALLQELVEAQEPVRFERSHFAAFGESALRFETVYYVLDADYQRYMDIQQAINLALLERFAAMGVEFAFPSRTVYHVNAGGVASSEG